MSTSFNNTSSFLYKRMVEEYRNKFKSKTKEDSDEVCEIREDYQDAASVRDSVDSFKSCYSEDNRDSLPNHSNSFLYRQQSRKSSTSDVTFRDSIASTESDESSNKFLRQTLSDVLDSEKHYEEDKQEIAETPDQKLKCTIKELILTEEQFQRVLNTVITIYKPHVEEHSPEDLKSNISDVFGNVEEIFDNSKEFLCLLKRDPNVGGVANAFQSTQNMFEAFRKYVRDKHKQDLALSKFQVVLTSFQKSLQDCLGLSSHLLTPLQRPGRYILMLEKLLKESRNNTKYDYLFHSINSALEMVKCEMRLTNDYLAMDSIIKCPFDLENEGTFLLKKKFEMLKPLEMIVFLFLFEKSVIFTFSNGKDIEKFVYLQRIKMDDLNIVSFKESHPQVFHLIDYEKAKTASIDQYTYILKAEKPRTKFLWIEIIEKALWDQFYQLKEQRMTAKRNLRKNLSKKLSTEAVTYLRAKRPISVILDK